MALEDYSGTRYEKRAKRARAQQRYRREAAAAKRAKREARKKRRPQVTCTCDAYPFPHRQGSEKGAGSARAQQIRWELGLSEPSIIARPVSVMRARFRRLVGFAQKREAAKARWGWGDESVPF